MTCCSVFCQLFKVVLVFLEIHDNPLQRTSSACNRDVIEDKYVIQIEKHKAFDMNMNTEINGRQIFFCVELKQLKPNLVVSITRFQQNSQTNPCSQWYRLVYEKINTF